MRLTMPFHESGQRSLVLDMAQKKDEPKDTMEMIGQW